MASHDSVKSFVTKINNDLLRLDVLIVNAGISTTDYHVAEGLEQTLTVNVVSSLLLCLLRLPMLQQTALQTKKGSHLTIVGSVVHCFADQERLVQLPDGKVFATLSDKTQADIVVKAESSTSIRSLKRRPAR